MTLPGSLGPRAELGRRRVTGGRPLLIPDPVATRADVCRHGFACDACLDGRAGANCATCASLARVSAERERAAVATSRRTRGSRAQRASAERCIHGNRPGACSFASDPSCGTPAAPIAKCPHGRVRGQCPYRSCGGPGL